MFKASQNSVLPVVMKKKTHFGSRTVYVDLILLSRGNPHLHNRGNTKGLTYHLPPGSAQITDHDFSL